MYSKTENNTLRETNRHGQREDMNGQTQRSRLGRTDREKYTQKSIQRETKTDRQAVWNTQSDKDRVKLKEIQR